MRLALLLVFAGCTASTPAKSPDLGAPDLSLPGTLDLSLPAAASGCTPTPLADVSAPTTVVSSCTQAALQAALDAGGVITFSCSGTITLASELTVDKDTVLDGGGAITLSGAKTTRILKIGHGDFESASPRITVQRLAFVDGKTSDVANTTSTQQGGAAIYRLGGTLTVVDCTFENNLGPATGQDVAGGAIYSIGGGKTTISGSTFRNNACSNGGAIGVLGALGLEVINSSFSDNRATGMDGNPGNGGNGGALVLDGSSTTGRCNGGTATGPFEPKVVTLCGVTIARNTANAMGGGFFRVVDTTCLPSRTAPVTIERSSFDLNVADRAGALYSHQCDLTLRASTVSNNRARQGGGLWIEGSDGADVTVQLENVTVAGNLAFDGLGGGFFLGAHLGGGTLAHVTVADNAVETTSGNPYAVFGAGFIGSPGGLRLVNSIVANNRKPIASNDAWNCQVPFADGGGNLQFPADPTGKGCAAGALVADPLLQMLGDGVMAIGAGSPAIAHATLNCPATDQRGQTRSTPCASGAWEP